MIQEEYYAKMGNINFGLAAQLFYAIRMVSLYQGGQLREDRTPYLNHLFDVSYQLYKMGLPERAVIGGILHDLPEDVKEFDPREIDKLFGPRVYGWVMALTKKPKDNFSDKDERLKEYHQRMFRYAANRDWTVIFGKGADRLHNLVTLHGLSSDPQKQKRVSQETLDYYVPFFRGDARRIVPVKYHPWLDYYAIRMEHFSLAYLEGNTTSTFVFPIPA